MFLQIETEHRGNISISILVISDYRISSLVIQKHVIKQVIYFIDVKFLDGSVSENQWNVLSQSFSPNISDSNLVFLTGCTENHQTLVILKQYLYGRLVYGETVDMQFKILFSCQMSPVGFMI